MFKAFAIAAILFSAFSQAQAGGLKTVDQLTCGQAIHQVKKSGRYYEASPDGALPIYPVYPMPADGGYFSKCTGRDRAWQVIVETTDSDACVIGYQCVGS